MIHLSSLCRHRCAFGFLTYYYCFVSATCLLRHTQAFASSPQGRRLEATTAHSGMTVMSSVSHNNNEKSADESESRPLRILALHGSEGSADQFAAVVTRLGGETHTRAAVDWQVHAVNAPFAKGDGLAWWLNPPGVRSYTATEYPGIDDSIAAVTKALEQQNQQAPVDLIVAHSQGAIFTTALLALQQQVFVHPHPRVGYILNGGAWPNPYTAQLEALQFDNHEQTRPRILIVTGKADRINPPDTQQRVAEALMAAGAAVTTVEHGGGHGVPVSDPVAVQQILDWIAVGMAETNRT